MEHPGGIGHRDGTPGAALAHPAAPVVRDRRWAAEVRGAARCAAGLLAMLLLIDGAAGTLTWWRAVLWATLAVLLLVVLLPARVSAGEGVLAARRLLRTDRVRTGLLATVRDADGVAPRLILCDALGGRVEIDPEVLFGDPRLWYHLAEGARRSEAAGTLTEGTEALHRLAERVDRETARAVFRASGLE